MNPTLEKVARHILKELISRCSEGSQMKFKRMYSHLDLEADINDVVDRMEVEKLDHAITQCENTLGKQYFAIKSLKIS